MQQLFFFFAKKCDGIFKTILKSQQEPIWNGDDNKTKNKIMSQKKKKISRRDKGRTQIQLHYDCTLKSKHKYGVPIFCNFQNIVSPLTKSSSSRNYFVIISVFMNFFCLFFKFFLKNPCHFWSIEYLKIEM